MSRLAMAVIAYLVLGALAFATLSDFRIRSATLLILGLFAFKSWVRRKDVLHTDGDGESEPEALAESRRPTADGGFEPM
ncbi:MAG: hypothetical protein ABSA78_22370 [Candidatus Sulfotelmatobacter sp.]|jgi:hypothetical protein